MQSGMEPIGLGWVHLADCKRISCHQCHAADGQFASDFQSGAKPFRSFGSPSAIRQQPLMACRWLRQPSCLCILRGPCLTFRKHSLWPEPICALESRGPLVQEVLTPARTYQLSFHFYRELQKCSFFKEKATGPTQPLWFDPSYLRLSTLPRVSVE